MKKYYLGMLLVSMLTFQPAKISMSQSDTTRKSKPTIQDVKSVMDERLNLIKIVKDNDSILLNQKPEKDIKKIYIYIHDTIYIEKCDTVNFEIIKRVDIPFPVKETLFIKKGNFLYRIFHKK